MTAEQGGSRPWPGWSAGGSPSDADTNRCHADAPAAEAIMPSVIYCRRHRRVYRPYILNAADRNATS